MSEFLPKHIKDLKAYSSAKSEKITGTTWLNANESPFNKTLSLKFDNLNRYPEPQPDNVIERYALYCQLTPDQILMTRGADEGIDILIRTFCEQHKDSIALFLPTYGMYKVSADSHAVEINALTQDQLLKQPVDKLCSAIKNSKLVFICNPNNPTGSTISIDKIERIAQSLTKNTLLVVDEAYIEFCAEKTCTTLLTNNTNIVILRTLSKAFGLAGLRCGFVLASPVIINTLKKVLAPYPVSTVVAAIAEQALSPDAISQMRQQVNNLNALKSQLFTRLNKSNAITDVLKSDANFITIKLKTKKAMLSAAKMGLIMRPFTLFDCDLWIRISIGSETELQQVTIWLKEIDALTINTEDSL